MVWSCSAEFVVFCFCSWKYTMGVSSVTHRAIKCYGKLPYIILHFWKPDLVVQYEKHTELDKQLVLLYLQKILVEKETILLHVQDSGLDEGPSYYTYNIAVLDTEPVL
jgi:hypothetical protein